MRELCLRYRFAVGRGSALLLAHLLFGAVASLGQTADIYVRAGATPAAPYDTWAKAFADAQSAFDYVASNGALTNRIHLAGQTFAAPPAGGNPFVYRLQNAANIIVRGGYEADPGLAPEAHPGTNNPTLWPTTLARDTGGADARVIEMVNLTDCRFEKITIRDGYWAGAGTRYGGGVLVSGGSSVVFEDCRIIDNQLLSTTHAELFGGGLAVADISEVTLEDSLVAVNLAGRLSGTGTHKGYGGGASVDGTSRLTVIRSMVRNNEARGRYGAGIGAGGGFYVAAGGRLDVTETVIRDNQATWVANACDAQGGAIYNAGALTLRNVLVAGNRSTPTAHSDGIYLHGGAASIVNCTVADNYDIGIRYNAGTVAVTNTIVWGHTSYDLRDFPLGAGGLWPDVWYSCIEDDRNHGFQGCQSVDPLFADRTHYHLQSTVGHYTNGYFSGGAWTTAGADSPLIDRGHPDIDWNREPEPNGSWANLGAYGNTEVAAKSLDAQSAPLVSNPGAMAWGHRTVNLRGDVTADGDLPLVEFDFWEIGNATTPTVSAGHADGVVLARVTGLTPGTDYGYRVSASNSIGVTFSSDAAFSTHPAPSVFYISTNGNHTSGTGWTSAFRDIHTALAIAEPGDTFYIAGETFTVPASFADGYVFAIRNLSGLVFRGGYAAAGDAELPGPRDQEAFPTVLERADPGADGRVLHMEGLSDVRFEGLTIRGGEFTGTGTRHGGGVYLSECTDVVFDGCRILDNRMRSISTATFYGGGMALLNGSTVTLTNSVIANHFIGWITGTGSHSAYGGGASVDGSSRLTVLRSHVYENEAKGRLNPNIGAGAGFYVAPGGVLEVQETVIRNNNATKDGTGVAHGGAIYNAGTLTLRNAVVAGNRSETVHSDGIYLHGGFASIVNCTVADNFDIGIRYNAGTVAVTNAIVWGHTNFDLQDFPTDGSGFWPGVWYSCIEDDRNDGFQGSLSVDPLFADRTYYHLKSTVGYYAGGYFGGGEWTMADADSPLIDRGHPDLDFSREPEPRGSGINIGAYGNTAVASKSLGAQSAPSVVNTGAQLWGRRTVRLTGDITDSGGELPLVTFSFWPIDSAPTSTVSVGYADGNVLADVSSLTPGTDYQYRVVASNSVGAAESTIEEFSTHPTPSVFYVATNGNHTAGTSWSTAYRDVSSVLSIVESDDTVLLAGQTFADVVGIVDDFVFEIRNLTNVTFRGAFAAVDDVDLPGPRNPVETPSILRRATGPGGRVLHLEGLDNVRFEGLMIRDGNWTGLAIRHGGGVHLSGCTDVVFEGCRITENRMGTLDGGGSLYGGGMALTGGSTVTLVESLINSNFAGHDSGLSTHGAYGGGVSVDGSSRLTAIRSTFHDNEARGRLVGAMGAGGAIYVDIGGILTVRESILRDNLASWTSSGRSRGGAIFNAGTLSVRNALLHGNRSVADSNNELPRSDAIFFQGGTASVENCTVADNHEIALHYFGGSVGLTNVIVWGHATADLHEFPEMDDVLTGVSHSLFGVPSGMDGLNGCIVADPWFVGGGDYRLRDGKDGGPISPAIDAGLTLPWMEGATDLAGNRRVQTSRRGIGRRVDMGAYEAEGLIMGTLMLVK